MEAEDEAAGLRAWHGEGAIRVFAEERVDQTAALLLERCVPGTTLAERPGPTGSRHRRRSPPPVATTSRRDVFRPLQVMCDYWADSFERRLADGTSGWIPPSPMKVPASSAR